MLSRPQHQPLRAIGYLRVSTEEQATFRAGLNAQRTALQAEAQCRGWDLELVEDGGYSAKDLNRPGLVSCRPTSSGPRPTTNAA